ncbi:substrate-binding domain-containing protein [Sinorhizobium psoraleae]|uniref:substrate-binding domain-containing protein n=1 Tax=Sinorhizobium psoraleae TaxID=520838 RepID=UPI0035E3E2F4
MKATFAVAVLAALMASTASAETIGVSMQSFDNNDEMAIGAIQALKAAGLSMDDLIIVGIDATQDGLAAMAAGDLDVTVFQNARGQSASAVDAAVALARGQSVDKEVWVPFELVTPRNMAEYAKQN